MQSDHTSQRRRRISTLTATGALIGALLVAVPGVAAADNTFTFEGGGFGHSVGMSQYGAYGMALDGYNWQQIITHYFTGTTIAPAEREFTRDPIWINLTQEQTRVELTVTATGSGPAHPVTATRGNKSLTAHDGETITVTHLGDGQCRVATPGESFQADCTIDLEWDGWTGNPSTALRLGSCSLPDWNNGGTKPCRYAYGGMRIRPDNNTQSVNVSIEIDVEEYLLGLNESPYSWGSAGGMEALRAQAVAARAYALHKVIDRGEPAGRPWCWCQLYDTTIDQYYVGWGHIRPEWTEAVTSTAGMVATHPSETLNGRPIPIEAFYSSSTFGATENSEDGFITFVPYLRSVDDHWSLAPAAGNPYGTWTASFTGSQLAARLPGMSSVTDLAITECSTTGAALEITFYGNGGPRAYATRDLRGRLGLLSMQITNAGSPPPATPPCRGGRPPEPDPTTTTTIPDQPETQNDEPGGPGPVVLVGLIVDDDGDGDSSGNGNGTAQCGEIVEVTTIARNEGTPLRGVGATVRSDDPYATVLWNDTSTYSNLGTGAEAGNDDDWDVAIADNTPDGHQARLTVTIDSEDGGPWALDVTIPVSCSRIDATAVTGTADINGNGTPDIASAYRDTAGRPHLTVRDSGGQSILPATPIAETGYQVIDLATMPNGTDAVVLLHNPDTRKVRVVIVDLHSGRKEATIRGGRRHEVLGLAVLPGGGEPSIAVLERNRPAGKMRVVVRRISDGRATGTIGIGFGAVGLVALGDIGRTSAPDIAVLGAKADGTSVVVVADSRSGKRVATLRFPNPIDPASLVAQQDAAGAPTGTLIVIGDDGGGVVVTTADARTRRIVRTVELPMAAAVAAVAIADVGGSTGTDLAVLGTAADGTVTAIVVDPGNGRTISGPEFPRNQEPRDLTALADGSGVTLVSLAISTAGEGIVTLRDAASGRNLGSFPIL